MTYVGELPSIKLLGTLIFSSGSCSLRCVLIGQNKIFVILCFLRVFKAQTFILPYPNGGPFG